jgi:hypothetical protein
MLYRIVIGLTIPFGTQTPDFLEKLSVVSEISYSQSCFFPYASWDIFFPFFVLPLFIWRLLEPL